MTQLDIIAEIITVLGADEALFTPVRTDTLPDGNGIFISLCPETSGRAFLNGNVIRTNELDFFIKHAELHTALSAAEEIARLFSEGTASEGIVSSGITRSPERISYESGMYVYRLRARFDFSEGGD